MIHALSLPLPVPSHLASESDTVSTSYMLLQLLVISATPLEACPVARKLSSRSSSTESRLAPLWLLCRSNSLPPNYTVISAGLRFLV
jgi:hypothetical protein